MNAAPVVDLHCHWLPGLDDGAVDIDETVQLLRQLHGSDVRIVVATPHLFAPNLGPTSADQIRECFKATTHELEALSKLADTAFLSDLQLEIGAECHVSAAFLEALESDQVLPLGEGRHLLLEFPHLLSLHQIRNAIRRVTDAGYDALLAHVERIAALHRDPGALEPLVKDGAVAQLNGGSLVGEFGPALKRASRALLKTGHVQVISSDAHRPETRPPRWDAVLKFLERRYGTERTVAWTSTHPAALLAKR